MSGKTLLERISVVFEETFKRLVIQPIVVIFNVVVVEIDQLQREIFYHTMKTSNH